MQAPSESGSFDNRSGTPRLDPQLLANRVGSGAGHPPNLLILLLGFNTISQKLAAKQGSISVGSVGAKALRRKA